MNIREDLKAFVDGELDEKRMAEIREAIAQDPELAAEVEQYRLISQSIKENVKEFEVVGKEQAIDAVLLQQKKPKKPFLTLVAEIGVAIIVMGVIGAIIFPVFAQSKEAAKKASPESLAKQRRIEAEMSMMDNADAGMAAPMEPMTRSGKEALKAQNAPEMYEGAAEDLLADQLIIRNGNFAVEVEDLKASLDQATQMTKKFGGYVENSYSNRSEGRLSYASMTLRIPEKHFDSATAEIREMGVLLNENLSGDNVTTQVADIEARLKVLRAEEEQYLTLLGSTKKIGEILEVKARLSQVRQQIESMDAQSKALRKMARLSTITLELRQKETIGEPQPKTTWLEDAWTSAVNGLSAAGRFFTVVGIFILVFSPIWLPIVGFTWWLNRKYR